MFKIVMFSALMMISSQSYAAALSSASNVQTPCRVTGHTKEPSCVLVHTLIKSSDATTDVTMDLTVAKKMPATTKAFSVIYAYQAAKSDLGIRVHRGHDTMSSDLYASKPTLFWVTTRDGGKTWSKLLTTDMDSVIAY